MLQGDAVELQAGAKDLAGKSEAVVTAQGPVRASLAGGVVLVIPVAFVAPDGRRRRDQNTAGN